MAVSINEAKTLITGSVQKNATTEILLENALGLVLAEDVIASLNLPNFDNSAMDGYAIRYEDVDEEKERSLVVVAEVQAGGFSNHLIVQNEAIRIFTGAALPEGADTVVIQEHVTVSDKQIIINQLPEKGSNIRVTGEQIKTGDIALQKGTELNPGALGFLACFGITRVKVIDKPSISVVITGDELVERGHELEQGQIYESNSIALMSAIRFAGVDQCQMHRANDNKEALLQLVIRLMGESDVIIFTGGISVGKYDFVGEVLKELQVEEVFYKVRQKPGGPLFFGMKGKQCFFGLPGNPAAVMACFYEYVLPALRKIKGNKDLFLQQAKLPLINAFKKNPRKGGFLKGKIENNEVELLDNQASSMMRSFAQADCLIYAPEDQENFNSGELIEVHYLPKI